MQQPFNPTYDSFDATQPVERLTKHSHTHRRRFHLSVYFGVSGFIELKANHSVIATAACFWLRFFSLYFAGTRLRAFYRLTEAQAHNIVSSSHASDNNRDWWLRVVAFALQPAMEHFSSSMLPLHEYGSILPRWMWWWYLQSGIEIHPDPYPSKCYQFRLVQHPA